MHKGLRSCVNREVDLIPTCPSTGSPSPFFTSAFCGRKASLNQTLTVGLLSYIIIIIIIIMSSDLTAGYAVCPCSK